MQTATSKLKLSEKDLYSQDTTLDSVIKDTSELEVYNGILGQDRAIKAIEFGVSMRHPAYNIYAMGESGIGRTTYIVNYLKEQAKKLKEISDWAYVANFDHPRKPLLLQLPAGFGKELKADFEKLIDGLLDTFPTTFETPKYQQSKTQIEQKFNKKYDQAIDHVEQEAIKKDIALFREAGAITFAPLGDDKAMDETEFARLPR